MNIKAFLRGACLAALLCGSARAQTPGALALIGPSGNPGIPQVTPDEINRGVNAELARKADASVAQVAASALTIANRAMAGAGTFVSSQAQSSVLAAPADGQGVPSFRQLGVADISGAAPLLNPAFTGGSFTNTALSNANLRGGTITSAAAYGLFLDGTSIITPQGSTNPQTLGNLANFGGVAPDWFKALSDGTDDAPSIQRVINALCGANIKTMKLYARHYLINSKINQPCALTWQGEGYQEQAGANPLGSGTWLDIGPFFISRAAADAPITITGGSGSMFVGFGVYELGMTPPPVAVKDAATNVIGWSPATWTPTVYPYVFYVNGNGSAGVTFRHLMFDGIYAGVLSVFAGRTNFEDIRGQVFANLINVQQSYDIDRFVDFHIWPYWSSADPVLQYQQVITSVLTLYRADTPFIDKVFCFDAMACIQYGSETVGVTTGVQAGSISCDSVKYCIWDNIASGIQHTGQYGSVRSFAQAWNTTYAEPVETAASTTAGALTTLTVNSTTGIAVSTIGGATGLIGPGVAPGATVVSVTDATHFIITPASAVAAGAALVVNPPVVQVPGSSMFQVDGSAIMQIGTWENYGSDVASFNFTNASAISNIQAGSAFVHANQMSPNSYLAKFPTSGSGGGSLLTLGMPPLIAGNVSGFAMTNTAPNGSGIGTLQWAVPTVMH